jgi:hypothetical protein
MADRLLRRRGLWAALAILGLAGCVERRMVIITDPPTAVVFDEKHQPLGASPVDRTFTYYGGYQFYLVKDGYETLIVKEKVKSPWYEYFPLDFISENLVPWTLRDVRYFHYTLTPAQVITPQSVLKDAETLRAKGQTVGVPLPPAAPAPGAPPAPNAAPPGPPPESPIQLRPMPNP